MATTLMILTGLLTCFIGITGIISGVFFNRVVTYPFYYSVLSRGVTLLVIGAAALVVGLALLIRMHWARTAATVVAVISAIANFMFLPFAPFWSIVVLALNVLIIWELTRERGRRGYALLPCPARVISGCAHLNGRTALDRRRRTLRTRVARWAPTRSTPRPMIGVNDTSDEILTVANAQQLAAFAASKHLAWLSMWSAARDTECPGGAQSYASPTCSSIVQTPDEFMDTLGAY